MAYRITLNGAWNTTFMLLFLKGVNELKTHQNDHQQKGSYTNDVSKIELTSKDGVYSKTLYV